MFSIILAAGIYQLEGTIAGLTFFHSVSMVDQHQQKEPLLRNVHTRIDILVN